MDRPHFFTYEWKNASMPEVAPRMKQNRWVSPLSFNAKSVLKSYVPSGILKCKYYAKTTEDIIKNLTSFEKQLLEKAFPKPWLKLLYKEINYQKGIG